ncbi:hypothetical protein [Micrococcus terreus]|uniref:hypothetical protein n=1 Tax=Micrococcus terreus TaxID=574650 RepID=UPI0030187B8E
MADTLVPVGEAVAQREAAEVLSGLLGETVRDEVGKDQEDSRTGTGLGPLGPVDSVRAWAALWGISAIPVWHRAGRRSVSSASAPRTSRRLARLVMPVAHRGVTLSRLRAALRSASAMIADSAELIHEDSEVRRQAEMASAAAVAELQARGFGSVMSFPVQISGSTSAPERRALLGRVLS